MLIVLIDLNREFMGIAGLVTPSLGGLLVDITGE